MTDLPGRSPAQISSNQTLRGIGLMCVALLCFSLLDSTAKWLGPQIGAVETSWARYVFSIVFVSFAVNPVSHPHLVRSRRLPLQLWRSLMLLGSTVLNFFALKFLPMTEAISIIFSTPLLVALLAGPVLNEWVGPRRLIAIIIGFGGILVVTRPGLAEFHPAVLFSLAGAVCYALYAVLTRMLASHDPPLTTMFYSGLAGLALLTPLLPFVWVTPTSLPMVGAMVGVGFLGALGHWLMILAHRHAPASTLSPFIYTQMLYAVTLGYLIFGDLPDRWTLAGSAIVIGSGLYLLHRERVKGVAH